MQGVFMKKKIIAFVISCILIICIMPFSASADDSNKCGENVYWIFEEDTLTIYGIGPMYDYGDSSSTPWYGLTSKIKKLVIKDGVTSIGSYSFFSSAIEKAIIGNDVVTINKGAFEWSRELSNVELGNKIERLEKKSFASCNRLTSIILPNSLTYIGSQAFFNGSLKYLIIPDNVNIVGSDAFYNNNLLYVSVGNNTLEIESNAFIACGNLTSIYIPNPETVLSSNAFTEANNVTIYCLANSIAETMAQEHSFNYQIISSDCEHNYQYVDTIGGGNPHDSIAFEKCSICNKCRYSSTVVSEHGSFYYRNVLEPTCTEDGYTGDKYCGICNQKIENGITINANGHNTVQIDKTDATCTQNGYTGDSYCLNCHQYVSQGHIVTASGHEESEWIIDKEPSNDSEGIKHIECKKCHALLKIASIEKVTKELSFWERIIAFFLKLFSFN